MFATRLIFIGMLGATPILLAQASPTASRRADLQIGGGFTTASPDTQPNRFNGGTAYADLDLTRHLGVEGEFHFVHDTNGSGRYEKTYEIGGRYRRTYGRFVPYAKLLGGRGVYNFTLELETIPPSGPPTITYFKIANLAYNMLAVGAGVDYRILPHLNARVDWEYQHWFSYQESSLSPNLLTLGAAYRF